MRREHGTRDGTCIGTTPVVTCGANTELSDGTCVSTTPVVTCGANTELSDGTCIGTTPVVTCGPDTALIDGECASTVTETLCGTDTTLDGNACISSLSCGSGTGRVGDQCVQQRLSTSLAQFTAAPSSDMQGYHAINFGSSVSADADFIFGPIATLSSNQSAAWLRNNLVPVGEGHVLLYNDGGDRWPVPDTNADDTVTLLSRSDCAALSLRPASGPATLVYASYADGQFTKVTCSTSGSVHFQRSGPGTDVIVTINATFADGTQLVDYRADIFGEP